MHPRLYCAIVIGLMLGGCHRATPPGIVPSTAVPAASASSGIVVDPTVKPRTGVLAPRPPRARNNASPTASRVASHRGSAGTANDPCAGLDAQELDDCLGYEAPRGDAVENQASRDFASEQRRRDRELLERDSDEAANAANDGRGDEPPADLYDDPSETQYYGEPDPRDAPPYDDYMPEEDLPPPDEYGN